jgi:O-antigen/teichoic acid export membrane protein
VHLNKLIYSNLIWRGFFYFTSFALNIALVRILGAEFSGKLYFFLNNVSLALLIGSLSFESGITYYVSRGGMPENMLSVVSIIWSISISIIIAIFFYYFIIRIKSFFKTVFFFLPA